jgi:transcriptional regulator with GAF, ATPase, and Fis domain
MMREAFARAVQAEIGAAPASALSLQQLCTACAEVSALEASIVLITTDHPQAGMAASDGAGAVEELQFNLGEGPGIDAHAEGHPVFVEDLAEATSRWTQFAPAARALGVGAVFAFPLRVGAIRTGVLSLYGKSTARLDRARLGELATLADLVTDAVLAMQSGSGADELAWSLTNATEHRAVVHQATGMIAMQLSCSVQDAFVRLRASAFAEGVGVDVVARRVVQRLVRFER